MTIHLLDVNVLIGLFWPGHSLHALAQQWYARAAHPRCATTPATESGFVRLVSNPAFSRDAPSPAGALALLAENLKRLRHQFWPDALPLTEAVSGMRVTGHRQWSDAYLLAQAVHHKARLVTFDAGIPSLLEPGDARHRHIQLLTAGRPWH